jgi:uncharacterized RDD family membrane protein YckC
VDSDVASARDVRLQHHHAGVVSRLAGFVLDAFVIAALFSLAGHLVEFLAAPLADREVRLSDHRLLVAAALGAWVFAYFVSSLAAGGRTLGMAVLGLRVVTREGRRLGTAHAVTRALVLPVSVALCGLGLLVALVDRDRRALHDLVAGTVVVYEWDARAARLRFLSEGEAS